MCTHFVDVRVPTDEGEGGKDDGREPNAADDGEDRLHGELVLPAEPARDDVVALVGDGRQRPHRRQPRHDARRAV